MYRHTTTCLKGPFSRDRAWWRDGSSEEAGVALADAEASCRPQAATTPGESGELRLDLIARVRRQIEAGEYDTPERWEAALDRLADRIL